MKITKLKNKVSYKNFHFTQKFHIKLHPQYQEKTFHIKIENSKNLMMKFISIINL